jgi:hypothetical protein
VKLPYESGKVELTSKFGLRTLNGKPNNHKGIDLVGRTTKTVVAPCDGVVGQSAIFDRATDRTGTWEWGNYVRIDTEDGLKIYMCHLAERKVKSGDKVKAGDVIGIEGNTGYSFGSHLHFEIRKNGVSVNPCTYLGIPNAWGIHEVKPAVVFYPDEYTHDGLTFQRVKDFAIRYHDKPKKTAAFPGSGEISGGFFAYFKSGYGEEFTLPVANLVADIGNIPAPAQKYLQTYVSGDKLRYSTIVNASAQFKGKKVSTLVVPVSGAPYVEDLSAPPAGCKYAISGVPTVRNGDDVDYYNYVKAQGWDDSCMYATYRHWLGVRNGEIWCISGRTWTKNYIYGMEFYKKVREEGFDDIICIDGGGSYYWKPKGGTAKATSGNRSINNKIRI